MKVKNESCLRSRKQSYATTYSVSSKFPHCIYNFTVLQVTALLRETFKNSFDPNDQLRYTAVPSVTYIWTRRPQWRRRHKNSKKYKYHRFPLPLTTSRIDENDFWDTLKLSEDRPFSRSSSSPYETCSSRPFVEEADSSCNDNAQQNCEVFSSLGNQPIKLFDRKSSVCETRSDSGLRMSGGVQLVRSILSQKRLGVRISVNSQNTLGGLEINKSIRSSVGRELSSDCSTPKRRVTFSNYVSENSATDTRSQISGIANYNDPREAAWWEGSYTRLSDVDDDFSLQTELSCLFSSMIFDDSRSSFFSLTASLNSERSKKSAAALLGTNCNEYILYINPSYSNESSCDLQSLPKIYAIDDCPECDGFMINNDYGDGEGIGNVDESRAARFNEKISERVDTDEKIDELRTVRSDEKISKQVDRNWKINELFTVSGDEKISRRVDPDGTINKLQMVRSDEKISERLNPDRKINELQTVIGDEKISERVVPEVKINELQTTSDEKISKRVVPDAKIFQQINTDPTHRRSIECITIRLKDISSTIKEVSISGSDFVEQKDYEYFLNNHASTDTTDLDVLDLTRSLAPVAGSLRNRANSPKSSVDEIFDFLQQPNQLKQPNNYRNDEVLGKLKQLQTVRFEEKISERVVPDAKMYREINTDQTYRRSTLDFFQQPSDRIDAAFLLKELSRVGGQAFGNRVADNPIDKIRSNRRIRETCVTKDGRKADNVDLLRIDTETYGEFETVLIEVENQGDCFEENELPKKLSSSRLHDCLREPCESLIVNPPEIDKSSELVASSASNFHNSYANCPGIDKCCLICGRKKTDNPRYLRPVCQVKGVTPSSRLENDPWINVMNKVVKRDNGKEPMPKLSSTTRGLNTKKDQRSLEESSKDSNSSIPKNSANDSSPLVRNDSEIVVEEGQEECCFSVAIADVENSSSSMSTVESNLRQILSSRDQSTSCLPEPERPSSTSFGFATYRGSRTQSAKTYFVRESVRTVEGTANRLLCVISETDSLMAVPPFLPKKPPDWFACHRVPTRKWSRR